MVRLHARTVLGERKSVPIREVSSFHGVSLEGAPLYRPSNLSDLIILFFCLSLGPVIEPPQCPIPGQVYMECGSACPPTCDDYFNLDLICPLVCVPGCQCLSGLVLDNDRCVRPKDCEFHCFTALIQPPRRGPY